MSGIRIKSRWFNSERPKTLGEIAGASAFIVWRVAQQVLKNMRQADFDIPPGPRYFDFLSEWLVFLIQIADRMIYVRRSIDERDAFTCALANRVGEILADNREDLLGEPMGESRSDGCKGSFIDLLNLRSADYADFGFEHEQVDYGFRRYLADHLTWAVGERDAIWVHDQVMEIEAPQAVAAICKSMRGLLGEEPQPTRRAASMSGE